ncbi:MAG: helix-turn-helix domain-containing protein [Gammaproteobacteria bacterium]|nr:helix-turn-helix domain-containing protein [Gammaproteobacteria bacterium]
MTIPLQDLVKHIGHSGRKILDCCWIRLPVYQYTAPVWAANKSGPQELDQILFELLKNGIATRRQLAKCLGIDDDSFIFTHLDILVREGYVAETDNRYAMTEHGEKFVDGAFMEESFRAVKFTFYWDEIRETVVSKPNKMSKRSGGKEPVKWIKHHGGLNQEELPSVVAESFNKEKRSQSLEYHSINNSERGGFIKSKEICAEYVAVFYELPSNAGAWQVELRKMGDDGELDLCRDLTEAMNDHDKPWRNQLIPRNGM